MFVRARRNISDVIASAQLNNSSSLVAGIESGEVVFLAHVHNPEIVGHPVDHFVLLDSVNIAENTFGATCCHVTLACQFD